jgi:phage internal scaffolding protein
MEFKTAYGERFPSQLFTGDESEVQQCFKDECDMNFILDKYRTTGLADHVSRFQGKYEDLSQPVDFQSALNVVISAQEAFDTLPSDIRKKFSNSPQEFLEFVNNPDNQEKLVEMGLAQKPLDQALPESPATVDPVEPAPPVE